MSELTYQRDSKKSIWISTDVYRALWLVAKANEKAGFGPDPLGDQIIREHLEKTVPQVFDHQKQIAKMEAELVKTLQ